MMPVIPQLFYEMSQIKGVLASLILVLNTVIMVSILLVFSLLKLLLPIKQIRVWLSAVLVFIAETWIEVNSRSYALIHGNKINIVAMPELSRDEWYLVVSNHQSMTDIPVLQAVLNKKIPFLKFFLKQELIWVPFLGLAWWALDFPFMQRYSREFLAKNPHLRGQDMARTQQACERFKDFPTSVINFVEGTRFTPQKQQAQNSPYQHLLKPKAGGIGFVMGSMGQQMRQLLLVTLVYQKQVPTMWQYLCGQYDQVVVECEKIVIPDTLLNKNYLTDEKFKTDLFNWCEKLWYKQDTKLQGFYERTDI